jgi:glyoxylase-like metal-dependent hydrolase (beta-lactamase superfamily II)
MVHPLAHQPFCRHVGEAKLNIYTLDLNAQNIPRTIAAFLVVGPEGPVLVETGPASTLEILKARLAEYGYSPADIRHVLVTHIHLDHAGAAGWWARQGVQIYVHHIGAPHLIDPAKLLSSAKRIYGDALDTLWGKTVPAPPERVHALYDGDTIQVAGLTFTALDTPGHAGHHHTFRLGAVAFVGDAAGVRLPGSTFTTLPTPPPEFDREAWQGTISRLLNQDLATLYLTHFGPIENAREHLTAFADLIDRSTEFARAKIQRGVARDVLLAQYLNWNRDRADSHGLSKSDFRQSETAFPTSIWVDGLMRYWRKRGLRSQGTQRRLALRGRCR